MHCGMTSRFNRIVNPGTGRTVMIPFDHGITFGPLPGIIDPRQTVRASIEGGANGIIFNQGLAGVLSSEADGKIGVIHMLTNSCTFEEATLFGSVERAIQWSADAVAFLINVGSEYERRMIEQTQPIMDACELWNIPSIAMCYPTDGYVAKVGLAHAVAHAARAGAELGATIVKTAWAGSKADMASVIEGCPAPLIVAGGSKKTVEETFQLVRDSIDVGAIGVAMGRNL